MRHIVNVMRPTEAVGSRGQPQGQPELILKEWPCSIDTLSGNKAAQARTVFAEARHSVKGYGNPDKPFKERDYLTGGVLGSRELFIGSIDYGRSQNQTGQIELLCGERTGG